MELLGFGLTQKLSKEKSGSRASLSRNEDLGLNSPDLAKHSVASLTEFRKSKYFLEGQANDFVFSIHSDTGLERIIGSN